ncbi:hypothetical protein BT96DRAFT_1000715 [Gymnopus androsaceus JB14]|uniref:Uncharacterized protein n=1 Tax=Gymnopus androsaceus JB14 TaxID=1447944 RepID=A0A6A4H213_9AGAR|nr:hypothetical protein BT96DRAFT_1000715 [Gymnopus androsaceus JB14]
MSRADVESVEIFKPASFASAQQAGGTNLRQSRRGREREEAPDGHEHPKRCETNPTSSNRAKARNANVLHRWMQLKRYRQLQQQGRKQNPVPSKKTQGFSPSMGVKSVFRPEPLPNPTLSRLTCRPRLIFGLGFRATGASSRTELPLPLVEGPAAAAFGVDTSSDEDEPEPEPNPDNPETDGRLSRCDKLGSCQPFHELLQTQVGPLWICFPLSYGHGAMVLPNHDESSTTSTNSMNDDCCSLPQISILDGAGEDSKRPSSPLSDPPSANTPGALRRRV